MTPQLKAALVRAFASGLIAGVLTAVTSLQATGDVRAAVLVGVVAFLSIVSTRGVTEGWLDSTRAAVGAVSPADVGANLILDQRPEPTPPADAPHGA